MILNRSFFSTLALVAVINSGSYAYADSINAGDRAASVDYPFVSTPIAEFDYPWAIAVLPDGRILITEKPGRVFLVTEKGKKLEVRNIPESTRDGAKSHGQNGLLDIAIAPDFANNSDVYYSYIEPEANGTRLALVRAKLSVSPELVEFTNQEVIWRQTPVGGSGQPGGKIAFDPTGKSLFLSVGDRMEPESAQDLNQLRGKVLRLNLDGTIPADNPFASKGGAQAAIWTLGHRNPYGLAFSPNGELWLHEMGPRGGDEFNLIKPGQNYGWPVVSNGNQYSGWPIPNHDTRAEFTAPEIYWNPVVSPAGLAFYEGNLFPEWQGSALMGGLSSRALIKIDFDENGKPDEAERWDMKARIRDVAIAPDSSVLVIEDNNPGRLIRLTPKIEK